ncbi:phage tail length tape measure family protein [Sphingobium sp. KCTC 72723]|uniref:phage tail length tape measure family protein n=1 Tax=Sphingobium sp. KCTC 72723 TaxID=2733867 RepID=UPI00165DB9EF|nr:hypothetical protein [Sphingobium sp. KCTC 72723]
MASRSSDIVARLALNAEAFSSENARAFGEMEKRASDAASRVKASFDSSFAEVQNMAKRALDMPRTSTGALNLDSASVKAAAAAAQNEAQALREIATAARQAATATGDTTQETRIYVQAASAAAIEAEQNARNLNNQAVALDRLQAELNQTSTSTRQLVQNQGRLDSASRNNQLAMRNLGYQVSDVGASVASGGSLFVIFGQQIGQVGGALSDMTGKAGALGRFLTNPWVAAFTTAAIVAGVFYERMDEGNKSLELAQAGADGLSQAQGVLGQMFDLTSGKLEKQNDLLIVNARLSAINLRREALQQEQSSRETFDKSGSQSAWSKARGSVTGALGLDGGVAGVMGAFRGARDGSPLGRRNVSNLQNIVGNVRSGKMSAEDALRLSETQDFTDTKVTATEFQQAIVDATAKDAKRQMADLIDKSLDDKSLVAALRRDGPKRKPKDGSKAAAALGEYGRDAADRITDITSRFGLDPSRVQQAEKAIRDLDDIIDDLGRRKPPNFAETIKSAEQAKIVVRESLDRPCRDLVDRAREREQIDALIIQGHFAEADALQQVLALERQMGPLNEQQLAKVLEITKAEEARARALEDQRRQVGLYVQAIGEVQSATEQLLSGGSVKDFGKNLLGSFKSLQARIISEGIFGGLDREIEDRITGRAAVKEGNIFLAEQARTAGDEIKLLGDAVSKARGAVAGAGVTTNGSSSALHGGMTELFKSEYFQAELRADEDEASGVKIDPNAPVVVTAREQAAAANDNTKALLSATDAFNIFGQSITTRLKSFGIDIPDAIGRKFGDILQGAALGGTGSSLAGLTGAKTSSLGGSLGGIAGKELLGGVVGKGLSAISSSLGSLGGPLGSIIGGVAGGLIGGMLKKAKYGTAAISMNQYGELSSNVTSGRGSQQKAAAGGAADNVIGGIENIAEALGAEISGARNVTIGTYKDAWRVSTTGRTGKLKGKYSDVTDFGKEGAEEAVAFAVQKSIEGSVITGISQASVNILKSGQDLEKAISKAVLIESIPKDLQRMLDPIGFAEAEVNKRFEKIVDALNEGGASAEQMAEAQRLYNLELADARENTPAAAQALKDFLSGMKAGSSSPLSLRDQEREARTVLDPYLGQINRGETVNQEKYLAAAQTFLDIERQLYGSTAKYFDAFSEIQDATGRAISTIDNAAPIRTSADPFIEATAKSAASTAADTSNMVALLAQTNALLAQLAANDAASGSAFIGTSRNFV